MQVALSEDEVISMVNATVGDTANDGEFCLAPFHFVKITNGGKNLARYY